MNQKIQSQSETQPPRSPRAKPFREAEGGSTERAMPAHAANAAVTALLDLLRSQHQQVDRLLARLTAAAPGRDDEKDLLQLARLLTAHAAIEEEYFYPALRKGQSDSLIDEAFDEHLDVKTELLPLLEGQALFPDMTSQLNELARNVRAHVAQEEGEIFAMAQARLTEEIALELLDAMRETYRDLELELGAPGQPAQRLAADVAEEEVGEETGGWNDEQEEEEREGMKAASESSEEDDEDEDEDEEDDEDDEDEEEGEAVAEPRPAG